MATATAKVKPVVVRVKRKQFQEPLDAFWLEINERSLKRPLLDFGRFSISDSAGNDSVDDAKIKKVFVQRIETVNSSDSTKDALESFLFRLISLHYFLTLCDSADTYVFRKKIGERKWMHKQDSEKKEHLRSVAVQDRENLARNARFEQIWKNRNVDRKQNNDTLHQKCHVYDVVRIDPERRTHCEAKESTSKAADDKELSKFLPLLGEFFPEAATEIESDLGQDNFVYDIYVTENDVNMSDGPSGEYPLVQVDDDDDFYDGPYESEYDSEDSNAENVNLHDYPDEESSEDDGSSEMEEYTTEDEFDDPGDSSDDEYDGEFVGMREEEIMELRLRYCSG